MFILLLKIYFFYNNIYSYAAPPIQQSSYAAPPLPSQGYGAPSGYVQPSYPRPFGVQEPTQYQGPVQGGYASNVGGGGYASSIDSGAASTYVQQKIPSGGSYQQGPGPIAPQPVGPGPIEPGPIAPQPVGPGPVGPTPVEPAPQQPEAVQEPGYESTQTPGYSGETVTQPASVIVSTEYGKEEIITPVEVPSSYGGSQATQAPSYGGSQTTVGGGYGGEVVTSASAVVTEGGYGKESATSSPSVSVSESSSYGEQLPSTAAPSKSGYGEESSKGKSGYEHASENSITPSQIGTVDYGEETNTSGDGNCEDPELRAIVEAAVNAYGDNLEAARKIEADAGSKFGGRFNSIVSNSEFAYVNWYGKRNCQLRVKERHTLTWED